MGQAAYLVKRLKKALKDRGLTYAELAGRLDLSESALKRAFAQNNFSLRRLEEICDLVGVELSELVGKGTGDEEVRYLSLEQETALAADPKLFGLFYLLGSGLPAEVVEAKFAFDHAEIAAYLRQLDRLGLLTLHPGDRFRMKVKPNVWWNDRGPLLQLYDDANKADFVRSDFRGPHEDLWLVVGRVSPASLRILSKKMSALVAAFKELVEIDEDLAHTETRSVTFFGAYRPWVMPLLRKMRRE